MNPKIHVLAKTENKPETPNFMKTLNPKPAILEAMLQGPRLEISAFALVQGNLRGRCLGFGGLGFRVQGSKFTVKGRRLIYLGTW